MKDGVFTTDMCPHTYAHTHKVLHRLTYNSTCLTSRCVCPSTPAFLPLCEDGHYKCKVVVEDCPRLLLIREGTGIPSHEVWSCGCM